MPYTPPTEDEFLRRFPEFESAEEYAIQYALADAGQQVDNSWREADYALAIMLLAAHYLSTGGDGTSSQTQGNIASESFGPISITYSQRTATTVSANSLGASSYGQRYLQLRKQNFPGPVVV